MKRYGLGIIVALVAVLSVAAAQPTDQEAILAIEKGWNDAIQNKDRAFFEKHLDADFTYVNEDGVLLKGRTAFIESMMKLPGGAAVTDTNEAIRVTGSTGVSIGHYVAKYKDGTALDTRYTDVYAKGPDGWKAIASHETNVAK